MPARFNRSVGRGPFFFFKTVAWFSPNKFFYFAWLYSYYKTLHPMNGPFGPLDLYVGPTFLKFWLHWMVTISMRRKTTLRYMREYYKEKTKTGYLKFPHLGPKLHCYILMRRGHIPMIGPYGPLLFFVFVFCYIGDSNSLSLSLSHPCP